MSDIYVGQLVSSNTLEHHGILGMKWGVRRFQREDGSLTSAGRKRKLVNEHKNEAEKKREFKENRHDRAARASQRDADDLRKHGYTKEADAVQKVADRQREKANAIREKSRLNSPDTKKRILKGAAIVGATALGAYAAYKIYDKKVPKYINVGKTIVDHSSSSSTTDLSKMFPQNPNHPNKVLKSTFNMSRTDNIDRTLNYSRSVPNPDRKIFKASGKNELNSGKLISNRKSFSDPEKSKRANQIIDKFNSDVDKAVKDYRSGIINRKEYSDRIKSLQNKVDISDKKKRR